MFELGALFRLDKTSALKALLSHRFKQVLVIQISSEADLYFLHALEVNEDDFQHLKVDQGILVDFSAFPEKLTELLKVWCAR